MCLSLFLFHFWTRAWFLSAIASLDSIQHSFTSLSLQHTIKTKRDTLQIDDQTGNQPLNQICNLTLSTTHHWIPFNFDLPQSGLESNCIRIQISIALCSSGSGSSITPVCVFGNRRVSLQPELRWKSHQIGSILNPGGRAVSYYRRVLEKLGSWLPAIGLQ